MAAQFAEFETLPAPTAGIDAITGLMEMKPTDALYAYNVIFTQNGPKVRPGQQDWCTNVAGAGGVRTIIPVRGAGTAGAQDFLFACTIDGIYNCTSSSTSPTLVVTFGSQTGNAGYCEYDFSTNLAGDVVLMVCDAVNGLYTFDTSTSTWVQVTQGTGATQISGVNPATFVSVRTFGQFVWYVQGGTGNAWYMAAGGAIYGTATQFNWGNKFPHGGNLNNLYIFTYGSSLGTYTYLVGIGDAGDVLAYQGSNPNSASTWALSGQWYVGDLPAGRRSCNNYGGDLNILSAYGIIQLSALFYQKDIEDPTTYLDRKIAPALAADFTLYSANYGFGFVPWPAENSLLITEPIISGITNKQWCYNLATDAWSVFNGYNMQHAGFWHGAMYMGTSDNRVIKLTGNQDGVATTGTGGVAINFGILGAFQQGKHIAVNKIVDIIQAYFTTDSPVSYQTFVYYDFTLTDLSSQLGSVPYQGGTPVTNGWDSGVWDMAMWSGTGTVGPQSGFYGSGGGIGKFMAAGVLGASKGNTTLIGYQISLRPMKGFM